MLKLIGSAAALVDASHKLSETYIVAFNGSTACVYTVSSFLAMKGDVHAFIMPVTLAVMRWRVFGMGLGRKWDCINGQIWEAGLAVVDLMILGVGAGRSITMAWCSRAGCGTPLIA